MTEERPAYGAPPEGDESTEGPTSNAVKVTLNEDMGLLDHLRSTQPRAVYARKLLRRAMVEEVARRAELKAGS